MKIAFDKNKIFQIFEKNPAIGGVSILSVFFIWSFLLYMFFNSSPTEPNRVAQTKIAPITNNNYVVPNTAIQAAPYVQEVDATSGQVLSAGDYSFCGQERQYYEDQLSCYMGDVSEQACAPEEVDVNGEIIQEGFCYGETVEDIRITEVFYPQIHFYGTNPVGGDECKDYNSSETVGIAKDPETGKWMGISCFNYLRGGGIAGPEFDPTNTYNGAQNQHLKTSAPHISKEITKTIEIKRDQEVPVMLRFKLATQGAIGEFQKGMGMLFEKAFRGLLGGQSPNTANRVTKDLEGHPLNAPVGNMKDRLFDKDECRTEIKDENILMTYKLGDPGLGKLKCHEPIVASHTVLLENLRKGSWWECFNNPTSEKCRYKLVNSLYVDSPWGSTYKCNDETCAGRSLDANFTYALSPSNELINFDDTLKHYNNPTSQPSYIITPCVIEYTDYSKLPGRRSGRALLQCIWEDPHHKYYNAWGLQSPPGVIGDPKSFYQKAVDQANASWGPAGLPKEENN
jgi:hypothetical protein